MTTKDDAKRMAKRLRAALTARGVAVTHADALEAVATALGYDDWNTAAARLTDAPAAAPATRAASPTVRFLDAVPILRIFDEAKAREFYGGFLGFAVDWAHRFDPGAPLYLQVSRAGLALHLSEHHGDASPGSTVFVPMRGVRAFHRELLDRRYAYNQPGLVREPWGEVVQVHDPFGNRLRFCERVPETGPPGDDPSGDGPTSATTAQ